MTDPYLLQARRNLADSKLWGRVSERAILTGAWDSGQLVQERLAAVPKELPEEVDE
jgi:hypothetical protein